MKKLFSVIIVGSVTTLLAVSAHAGSALWDLIPASGDWNVASNWNPSTVPNGPADTATFGFSISTGVSLSANTEVNSIVFNSTALIPYSVTVGPNSLLTISGAGIINNSGNVEAFVTTADMPAGGVVGGRIFFSNSATAGSSTVFTNNASTASVDVGGGFLAFSQSTSASTATITNNGGSVRYGRYARRLHSFFKHLDCERFDHH